MGRKYSVATALLLVVGASQPARAALDPDENVYRHKKLGLKLSLPDGWTPSTHTGYPSTLLLLLDPAGATLSLSVGTLATGTALGQHVAENNQGLRKAGLLVLATRTGSEAALTAAPPSGVNPLGPPQSLGSRSVVEVVARREDSARELRQIYFARGSRVFVLTLCAPPARIAALLPELQALVRTLEIN